MGAFFLPPPCGGGLGWGVEASETMTPTPTLPPQGGRERIVAAGVFFFTH
jgi:hypothetical protein